MVNECHFADPLLVWLFGGDKTPLLHFQSYFLFNEVEPAACPVVQFGGRQLHYGDIAIH